MSDTLTPPTVPFLDALDTEGLVQYRIRHVTSIQVRNLTPFPVRDSLTAALSKPTEQRELVNHGHVSDDLDASLSLKRTRRTSTHSISTLRSLRSDDGETLNERGRRRTDSKVNFQEEKRPRASSSTARTAPTIRPHRVRTTSLVSSLFAPHHSSQDSIDYRFSVSPDDHSQTTLEKIIQSRLVETFVGIIVTPARADVVSTPPPTSPQSPRFQTSTPPLSPKSPRAIVKSRETKNTTPVSTDKLKNSRHESWSSSKSTVDLPIPGSNGPSRSVPTTQKPKTQPSPSPLNTSHTTTSTLKSPSASELWPDYISPIHRASTNPLFPIDPRSEMSCTDISGHRFKVVLWAKIRNNHHASGVVNGKGKDKDKGKSESSPLDEWQILEEWEVDLKNLKSLPDDLAATSQLPSNTLLLTLDPPGRQFYIPSHFSRHRPPSPTTGYASDPESDLRKVKQTGIESFAENVRLASAKRRHRRGTKHETLDDDDLARSSGWQDLFKLVTLQSLVIDTERSLAEIIRSVNDSIIGDTHAKLKREICQRESRIAELRANCDSVELKSENLREQIRFHRQQLLERQRRILSAQEQDDKLLQYRAEVEEDVQDERSRLESLRVLFVPTRTALISALAYIYPIELLSPPDLLYTILDVPLPIPLTSNDPAPPLSLSNHKDINEETVATSLGYAGQVVQLLAAYLGRGLIYPVTCIGSRSLIRDNISAMVGPRMFPLFSKGVDTYRFEYAVFLLNKNIEMLMAEYELRALDIRHTLPNLKNLLLSLTDGSEIPSGPPRRPSSPISSLSGLESPRAGSPVQEADRPETPTAAVQNDFPGESTPPASGSTTPTAISMDTVKRSRFLTLPPLSGFLRVRYPSSLPVLTRNTDASETVAVEQENGEAHNQAVLESNSDLQDADGEDEMDRRTIRSLRHNPDAGPESQEGKRQVENSSSPQVDAEEKDAKVDTSATTTSLGSRFEVDSS
ncbi:hypothetical protein K435DRAFT_864021 [Dendrothele bispora CBS 962.96]|uniref:Autophagy-related protein 14 n=1 Tax=Dendrothele bispora (strain CBS 962.96) TaxID=1314807 RepID=A0A4S8LN65_DENBC|nr:hypothetical protein K435DRAFT_864021 [Dendrothele bispora CBS 962.96]